MINSELNIKKSIAFVSIKCTFKNTLITLSNSARKPFFQISSKSYDIKTKRKNNTYVLNQIAIKINTILKNLNYSFLAISIEGIGPGRHLLLNNLIKDLDILYIRDNTRIPFNGCRPKKKKRK